MLKWIVIAVLILLTIGIIWPRVASDDLEYWSVDPSKATPPSSPNTYLLAGKDAISLPSSPSEVMGRFEAIALSEPRVQRLFRSDADGLATYVQRSAVFAFPDYISIHVEQKGNGSLLSIYSRSRYGHSDLGINKARVERWLGELK